MSAGLTEKKARITVESLLKGHFPLGEWGGGWHNLVQGLFHKGGNYFHKGSIFLNVLLL